MWDSACENIERAAREYRDTRSPEQKAFAANASRVNQLVKSMARYTAGDSTRWASDPTSFWVVNDLASELERRLQAMRVDGPVAGKTGAQ